MKHEKLYFVNNVEVKKLLLYLDYKTSDTLKEILVIKENLKLLCTLFIG